MPMTPRIPTGRASPEAANSLAQPDFWEQVYLADVRLPARPDPRLAFDRELQGALERYAPMARGQIVLEVGCAPAKWLAFYAERFGARPVGIEYTAVGADLSRRNLAALGIDGEVIEADFFSLEPRPADLVLSLGFIEHFPDVAPVFSRHADFVPPGGLLVIGVPNYRGLLGGLQRWADPEHLELHNRDAMRPAIYRELGASNGLEVVHQHALDGPDPIIIKLGRRSATPAVYAMAALRRLPGSERLNHPLVSAYLLTVLRRPR